MDFLHDIHIDTVPFRYRYRSFWLSLQLFFFV